MTDRIQFKCPTCEAEHDRGFVDGVDTFRCLRCGYTGHGFHPDPEIDRALLAEHNANNMRHRQWGIPEVPLGVDPLSFGQ
jgi:rubredoxin